MSETPPSAGLGAGDVLGWVARLTHRPAHAAATAYTVVGRLFESQQEAELTVQCWWATGYGRRGVIAAHVRPEVAGHEVSAEDWIPVSPGAKEACLLLGAHRPRTEPPGTLRLVPLVGDQP